MLEVPKILVGVQGTYAFTTCFVRCKIIVSLNSLLIFIDSINDSNPRVIKDVRPRKLACDLRCPYYETCAIYGLNVERVFQDGKNNIMQK